MSSLARPQHAARATVTIVTDGDIRDRLARGSITIVALVGNDDRAPLDEPWSSLSQPADTGGINRRPFLLASGLGIDQQ